MKFVRKTFVPISLILQNINYFKLSNFCSPWKTTASLFVPFPIFLTLSIISILSIFFRSFPRPWWSLQFPAAVDASFTGNGAPVEGN